MATRGNERDVPVIDGFDEFVFVGEGMTSTVWRAHQLEFDRDVAG